MVAVSVGCGEVEEVDAVGQFGDGVGGVGEGAAVEGNLGGDGQAGLQELAGNATLLFYMTQESQEGRNAFVQKRKPDFSKFPKMP